MKKLKLPFSKLSPVALWSLLSNVITKMTGNSNFANPAVAMAILQAAADKLAKLIDLARNGSRQDKMQRDDQVKVVESLLRQEADYVALTAKGDATILESAGFPMSKTPEPVIKVTAPKSVVAMATTSSGEIEFRFSSVHGAHFYKMFQADTDPNLGKAEWKLVSETTRVRNIITGLDSFKAYWFCASAIGVNGESVKSAVVVACAA